MTISGPFIRRPIATSLIKLGVLFAGAATYPVVPVAPQPQIEITTKSV
jgi:multidrug efflux pump subunit AcrB